MKNSKLGTLMSMRGGVLTLAIFTSLHAGTPPGTFRNGQAGSLVVSAALEVAGRVDGDVALISEEASAVVGEEGAVTGEIVLPATPAAENVRKTGRPDQPLERSKRSRIEVRTVAPRRPKTVRSELAYELPRLLPPGQSAQDKQRRSRQDGKANKPVPGTEDLFVSAPESQINLLPGSYRSVRVHAGTVFLGVPDSIEPAEYIFESLDVNEFGALLVRSPVVVHLRNGSTWRGRIGAESAPLWLDLRIYAGEVSLREGCEVSACVTALKSDVVIAGGAKLTGSLVAKSLTVAKGGEVVVTEPEWDAPSSDVDSPRFIHRALALEVQMPGLREAFRHSYVPGIVYVENRPILFLTEQKRPKEHPRIALETAQAVLHAIHLLFAEGLFESATIVVVPYNDAAEGSRRKPLNLQLQRTIIERAAQDVTNLSDLRESVNSIWKSPRDTIAVVDRILMRQSQQESE